MKPKRASTRIALTSSLVVVLALIATVPLNMGGCSASGVNIAGLVNAGGKAIKASSLDQRHEKALGESVSLALTNEYGVSGDEKLQKYVMFVGLAVASRTPRASGPWVFGVLDTDKVNAFSGPGGYVWVTRGAIAQMQDESELAGVLAHEIGHVIKQHGLKAAQQAGLSDAALTAAASSNSTAAQFNGVSDKLVDVLVKQGFTEPQEFEADQVGVKYVAAAGYDPDGFLHFLQRIRAQQKSGGTNLFSTHPGLDDRIKRVIDQISSAGTGGRGATLAERFEQSTGKQPSRTAG